MRHIDRETETETETLRQRDKDRATESERQRQNDRDRETETETERKGQRDSARRYDTWVQAIALKFAVEVCYHQPSERDQTAVSRSLICTGAHRNPTTYSINLGD
jgi:hypothetical protein